MRKAILVAGMLGAGLVSAPALGTVAVSNMGNATAAPPFPVMYMSFTTGNTPSTLNSIATGIHHLVQDLIQGALYTDKNGMPGTKLESYLMGMGPDTYPITFTSAGVPLAANST